MIPASRQRSYVARQAGTLLFSHVTSHSPMLMVRAAAWANHLARLGIHLPWFVVHDVGILLAVGSSRPESHTIGPHKDQLIRVSLPDAARTALDRYGELISMIADSEVVQKAATWRLKDDLVAVLLAKIFGDLYNSWNDAQKAVGTEPMPLDPGLYTDLDLVQHFGDFDAVGLVAFVELLANQRLHLYTSLEQIDLDTLRFLGMFSGASSAAHSALDLVDLMGLFQSPEANDVVNFSLELLPSVLETKRAAAVQSFSIDGYASVERRGNLDSLILSEFAYDDELFEAKVLENELFYYGHEKQREEERRLQYLLVDSSPSMRGMRQVFARGLALTLAKRLQLEGDEVWMRFFDSRLYDTQKVSHIEGVAPYLLCFRSDRGRNYARVFRQFALELERLRFEERRQVVVYVITHGQCHIPVEIVERMRAAAYLYGVFILPSAQLGIDYLHLLHRHQVVDDKTLFDRTQRRERALEIVSDAGAARQDGRKVPTARAAR